MQKPDVPRINEFTDYLVVNYIEQEALFPIQLWKHWEQDEKRTDNDLEGYNRRLSVFLKSHPNIWKFIEAIKVEDTKFSLKFIKLESGLYRTLLLCYLLFYVL